MLARWQLSEGALRCVVGLVIIVESLLSQFTHFAPEFNELAEAVIYLPYDSL